jgi:hypothetical protein
MVVVSNLFMSFYTLLAVGKEFGENLWRPRCTETQNSDETNSGTF